MAAAFFRRRSCLNYLHRELCRVVWRPQAALYCSKPSDRKPPRITHISKKDNQKAKPQPAVDVAKLLEQLFSQRRPGTAPPGAGKATKDSTISSTNVSTSDVPHSSKTNPAVSVSPAASTITSTLNAASLSPQPTPASSTEQPPGFIQDFTTDAVSTTSASPTSGSAAASAENQTSAQTLETKVETAAETDNVEKSSVSAVETATEPSTESSHHLVEALETQAPVVEGPVEPLIDITVDTAPEIQMISKDSGEEGTLYATIVESSVETAIESSVKTSINPVEAVEAPVEPLIDVTVDTAAPDSGQVGILYTVEPSVETAIETSADTSISPQETSEGVAPVEVSAESMIDITLIETAVESPVEVSLPPVETRASVAGSVETIATAEAPVEREQATSVDLEVVSVSYTTTVEPSFETTVDPSGDATLLPVVTLETTIATVEPSLESAVEPSVESMTSALESEAADLERTVEIEHSASIQNAQEPAVLASETKVESRVESTSGNVAVKEEKSEAAQMTLESVTLHSVKTSVDSLKTDELLQTKFTLDEKVEKRLQELLVGAEHEAAAKAENTGEDEGDIVSKVLSQWSSLSDDLQELEGETATLMTELVCRIPAAPPGTDDAVKTSSASDQTAGDNVACVQVEEEEEAMTLESITLSEVEAEVEILETEALQETSDALEKEADALAKEEKMEVTMATGDVVYSDTAEAEILTLDSISEAADVIEAEIAFMTEAMFGSEQGPRQTESLLPKLGLQNEVIDQEAEKESADMSVESVTLVEVEASLGTLENESLSETTMYLENEAEVLAGETRTEVEEGTRSEEIPEGLDVESLSLAEDLQTDALMEELLFTVPGPIAGVTEAQVDQEVVGANISDELDPVQRLFLEKIREYNNLRRSSGGPVEEESDHERHLSEETAKLQRLYGGGDLSSFPQFTFTEPELDQDPK
ncbi:mediator of DNA damage checkpoint protein 1 isoform X1 [Hippoglossus hippoglossus]|uniref:mediator of DNA damage checkpoint protein 1 isoform X1 n=1 Tax=Hippoglossus hippoglossus TaxID=8267 RepID=UPI00148D2125|nr:mediator of DNA damage checkpoint protein 1 isoform X1 [Hippoglossus hippoglossus]